MAASSPAPPAPWRDLFLEHIGTMPSPEFVLGTVRKVPSSKPGSPGPGFTYSPRARTCIHRGLWADLPVNPKNDAELNPAGVYESDCPTFTTDVRMDKMAELWDEEYDDDHDDDKEKKEKKIRGTGGGAPVEATWWAAEPKVQWRVRGRAYVLAPDVDGDESRGGRETVATLMSRMRRKEKERKKENEGSENNKDWSFGREITAHFGNLSPGMRGSFKNPPSGRPVHLPVADGLALGQKVTDVTDAVARANFRVVVIVPEEVDRCDLSDPERGRRWLYTFVGGAGKKAEATAPGGQMEGEWEKVEVWP